jgi:hypothetical protein
MNEGYSTAITTDVSNLTQNALFIKKFLLKIECPAKLV